MYKSNRIVHVDNDKQKLIISKDRANTYTVEIRGTDISGNPAFVSAEMDAQAVRSILDLAR